MLRRFLLLLAFSAGLSAFAQSPAPGNPVPGFEKGGYETITQGKLRADLTYLSSDKLLGRMSLQPGDDEATQWVADQFRAAHLLPAARDAAGRPSFLQSFELVEYRPDRAATTLTLLRGGQSIVFHAPEAVGAFKRAVDLSAPVAFAGFGITAPELGYDDYAHLDVHGKIVLIFDHEPQEDDPHSVFNGTGNTRYATTRVKLLNAQRHGALAVVLVAEPNRTHPTNAERSARIGGSITRTVPLPLQAIEQDELTIPSMLVLDAVAAQILATSGTDGHALQAAIDKDLTPQSRLLPDTTLSLHLRNASSRSGTTANVAGLLPGSDPRLAADTVLISAHHDHDGSAPCPTSGQEDGKPTAAVDQTGAPMPEGPRCLEVWHGADDNGPGTVGVVALARAFAGNPVKPKRSVLFVVFASEERGLLGSYWMAAHPLRPLDTTRAMINFDMIGRDEKPSPQTNGLIQIPDSTSNRLNLIGALYSPTYEAVVEEENRHVGLTLDDRFDHESALNVFFRSDQFPFVLHNVPAFWWFTGFHPDYHHVTDTVEKIDFPKMQRILDLAYLAAFRFADDAKTPVFLPNPGARTPR